MNENNAQELEEQMKDFLDLQLDEVSQKLTIINPLNTQNTTYWRDRPDPGKLDFYRIDKVVPEKLFPNMPKSAMSNENTTVPRITCAPSLIGCIVGYFRAEQDLLDSGRYGKDVKKTYKGGYYITTIEPELILKPATGLVSDQERSDEHWIVPFNSDHVSFTPKQIGKFFITKLTHINVGGQNVPPKLEMEVLLECTQELCIGPGIVIDKGYWKFDIHWESLYARDVRKTLEAVKNLTRIEEDVYTSSKKLSANLLSHDLNTYFKWK